MLPNVLVMMVMHISFHAPGISKKSSHIVLSLSLYGGTQYFDDADRDIYIINVGLLFSMYRQSVYVIFLR